MSEAGDLRGRIRTFPNYSAAFTRGTVDPAPFSGLPMKPYVFVIARDQDVFRKLESMPARGGPTVHRIGSAQAGVAALEKLPAICAIVDLPGLEGLRAMQTLRNEGFRAPVILVA